LDTRLTILLCKRNIVAKSKEVKTEWSKTNVAESSNENYGSKMNVFQEDDDNCIVRGCDSVQFNRYNVSDEPIGYIFSR
jgi:hypothetical protein